MAGETSSKYVGGGQGSTLKMHKCGRWIPKMYMWVHQKCMMNGVVGT